MNNSEIPKIKRLNMVRRVLKIKLEDKVARLEDALQEVHSLRFHYFRIRKAYHFIDRELAKIDGRYHLLEPTGIDKPRKSKEQKAVEKLDKEQLTELITKLESLRERETL